MALLVTSPESLAKDHDSREYSRPGQNWPQFLKTKSSLWQAGWWYKQQTCFLCILTLLIGPQCVHIYIYIYIYIYTYTSWNRKSRHIGKNWDVISYHPNHYTYDHICNHMQSSWTIITILVIPWYRSFGCCLAMIIPGGHAAHEPYIST